MKLFLFFEKCKALKDNFNLSEIVSKLIAIIDEFKNNFDIVISNNDTQILDKFNCKKKFVISHSIQSIEKALRKKQLISYFRNKPKYLLLGNYHKSQMSKIFSIYGTDIIDYGVDEIFETMKISNNKDNKISFFTSRQDRNLDILVEVWKENMPIYIFLSDSPQKVIKGNCK